MYSQTAMGNTNTTTTIKANENWNKNSHKSLRKLEHTHTHEHQRNQLISWMKTSRRFPFPDHEEKIEKRKKRKRNPNRMHNKVPEAETYFFWHIQLLAEATASGRQFKNFLSYCYYYHFVQKQPRQRVGYALAPRDGRQETSTRNPTKKRSENRMKVGLELAVLVAFRNFIAKPSERTRNCPIEAGRVKWD